MSRIDRLCLGLIVVGVVTGGVYVGLTFGSDGAILYTAVAMVASGVAGGLRG